MSWAFLPVASRSRGVGEREAWGVIGLMGGHVSWRVFGVIGCALLSAACSTTSNTEEAAARRFLPTLPSLPDLPSLRLAEMANWGTHQAVPAVDQALEPVLFWRVIEDDVLVVHALTNGCTARSDFDLDVERVHDEIYTVRIERGLKDMCDEELPWGIQLGFGFEELGVPVGGQVLVLNPVDQRAWDDSDRERVVNAAR